MKALDIGPEYLSRARTAQMKQKSTADDRDDQDDEERHFVWMWNQLMIEFLMRQNIYIFFRVTFNSARADLTIFFLSCVFVRLVLLSTLRLFVHFFRFDDGRIFVLAFRCRHTETSVCSRWAMLFRLCRG